MQYSTCHWSDVAERRIREAIDRGELDDLRGAGKPLELDDNALVPDEWRLAFRVLKNAGFAPPEVCLRGEINELHSAIADLENGRERARAERRLSLLRSMLAAQRGRETPCPLSGDYTRELVARLA